VALGAGIVVSGWARAQPKPSTPPPPPVPTAKPATVEPRDPAAAAKDPPPAPERPKEEVIAQDLQKFPGTWVAIHPYLDDKKMTDPPPPKGRAPMFKGRRFIFTETHCTDTNGAATMKYLYKVDPTKTPKELDLIPVSSEGVQPGGLKLVKAIYAFDGEQ